MFQAEGRAGARFLRQENASHVGGSVRNLGRESGGQGCRDGSQSVEGCARTWLLLQVNESHRWDFEQRGDTT